MFSVQGCTSTDPGLSSTIYTTMDDLAAAAHHPQTLSMSQMNIAAICAYHSDHLISIAIKVLKAPTRDGDSVFDDLAEWKMD